MPYLSDNHMQSMRAMLKRCRSLGMQAQLDEAHQNAEELRRQASSVRNELDQCKQAAAAQAAAAAEKLAEAKVFPPAWLSSVAHWASPSH